MEWVHVATPPSQINAFTNLDVSSQLDIWHVTFGTTNQAHLIKLRAGQEAVCMHCSEVLP